MDHDASRTERAIAAAAELREHHDFVSFDRAEAVVVLGGDGFMLHTLHAMLERGSQVAALPMNVGSAAKVLVESAEVRRRGFTPAGSSTRAATPNDARAAVLVLLELGVLRWREAS